MKLHFIFAWVFFFTLAACAGSPVPHQVSFSLASFTENYVDVSIRLDGNEEGEYFLSAMFTPPEGYHLYSKDIPLTGVDGLGRPTLLELTGNSQLKAIGKILESAKAEEPNFEPKALLVYPSGAVTLSLPVELPAGNEWVDDAIKVTFMACSDSQCKPPVTGKVVSIRVPGADAVK